MNQNGPIPDLVAANEELTRLPAQGKLRWAIEQFGDGVVMLASMQKSSSVMMHMFHQLGLDNEILFVDTGFHFHETLQLRDTFLRRFKLNILTLYPELTPAQQEAKYELKLFNYVDGQPDCCRMRKEEPFLDYVRAAGKRMVISGLRASEGGSRKNLQPVAQDPRFDREHAPGLVLHPLLDWTDADIDVYLHEHDVPVHALHAQRYPSIGCEVCTTPVAAGEEPRAGRWRHLRTDGDGPQYCGLNFSDGGGI